MFSICSAMTQPCETHTRTHHTYIETERQHALPHYMCTMHSQQTHIRYIQNAALMQHFMRRGAHIQFLALQIRTMVKTEYKQKLCAASQLATHSSVPLFWFGMEIVRAHTTVVSHTEPCAKAAAAAAVMTLWLIYLIRM